MSAPVPPEPDQPRDPSAPSEPLEPSTPGSAPEPSDDAPAPDAPGTGDVPATGDGQEPTVDGAADVGPGPVVPDEPDVPLYGTPPAQPPASPEYGTPAYGHPPAHGASPYGAPSGAPAYGAPRYGDPGLAPVPGGVPLSALSARATWSLVLGILGVVLACGCAYVGLAAAIPAVVLGNKASADAARGGVVRPPAAAAGVALGWVGIALAVLRTVMVVGAGLGSG